MPIFLVKLTHKLIRFSKCFVHAMLQKSSSFSVVFLPIATVRVKAVLGTVKSQRVHQARQVSGQKPDKKWYPVLQVGGVGLTAQK